jgi:regulator of sigma E protease
LPYAFNRQTLIKRTLIVAAGPVANLVLAAILYAAVNWLGQLEPLAVLAPPTADSLAAGAGLKGGELVRRAAIGTEKLQPIESFSGFRWMLMRAAISQQDLRMEVSPMPPSGRHQVSGTPTDDKSSTTAPVRELTLALSSLTDRNPDMQMMQRIGILMPRTQPTIEDLKPGSAGQRSGLQAGDKVRRIGDTVVVDGSQLVALVRAQVRDGQGTTAVWQVERGGKLFNINVTPNAENDNGRMVGRIGARIGGQPEMTLVRLGAVASFTQGSVKVWQVSALTLRFIGQMITGDVSLKNLSGPVAIADFAGKSAQTGLIGYLEFLAFVSVSLGLMNLLPVPVLDGGHLVYFLWEAVTGKPVAGAWLERLQLVGLSLLLALMALTLFNDISSRVAG